MGVSFLFEKPNENRVTPEEEPQTIVIKTTTFSLDEPLNCVICLDEFIKDEEVNITPCKHFLHKVCANDLINNKIKKCPICRTNLLSLVVEP